MKYFLLLLTGLVLFQCTPVETKVELPVLGARKIEKKIVDGVEVLDTVTHRVGAFSLVDQDSTVITDSSVTGKVYVADFFFTSCPTICPIMKKEMLRVYEKYQGNPDFQILSYSIDPEYDTVGLLAEYASRLGVSSDTWHFLTGEKEAIFDLAEKSYMVVVDEDADAPGGFIHSGAFLLVDKELQIRGVYDGTVPEQVNLLMTDIQRLLDSDEETGSPK